MEEGKRRSEKVRAEIQRKAVEASRTYEEGRVCSGATCRRRPATATVRGRGVKVWPLAAQQLLGHLNAHRQRGLALGRGGEMGGSGKGGSRAGSGEGGGG